MFSMGSSNSRESCHKLQHSGAIIKTIGKWREKNTFDFSYHLNFLFPHLQESIWRPYKSFPTVTQRAVVAAGWSIQRMCLFCSLLHRDQSSPGRTWLEVRARVTPSFSHTWRVCAGHVGLGAICLMDRNPRAGKSAFTSPCVDKCGTNCQQWPVPPYWPCLSLSAKGRNQGCVWDLISLSQSLALLLVSLAWAALGKCKYNAKSWYDFKMTSESPQTSDTTWHCSGWSAGHCTGQEGKV